MILKVLFISRLYPNEYDPRNGAVIHKQALELKRQGIEVQVISPVPYVPFLLKSKRRKWTEYFNLPLTRVHEGIKIWHPRFYDIPLKSFNKVRNRSVINSGVKILEEVLTQFEFDLIHSHMAYPDSSLGVYLKGKLNTPLITTIRSTDMDISIKDLKLQKYMKGNLEKSNLIISPSPQLSHKLDASLGLTSNHIGNGIYPIKSTNKTKENFKKGKYKDKLLLLSISQLIEWKGIKYNILALSKLVVNYPDLVYVIVGDGPEMSNLKLLVKKLKLESYVFFTGDISHNKAMEYMEICDVFSMPSYRETFGLVYLEAMYLKKPIILCENNGVDGIVINKESALVVPPKNHEAIEKSINLLLSNPIVYQKLSQNGYEIVNKHYLWNEIGIELSRTYKLVGDSGYVN